ncbi:MAG: molybdenum cofactor guanylyltransferase [Eubacteriaceae bacterium]
MELVKTAAILVGGLSRRMGFDKKNLVIKGESLLERIVNQLSQDFDDVIIIGADKDSVSEINGIRGVYPDAFAAKASLVGIYSALLKAQSQFLYVTACDMPLYNHSYVEFMKTLIQENPKPMGYVTKKNEWIEPFNAFYNIDLIPQIKAFLESGQKNIYYCIENENIYYINEEEGLKYSPQWDMFRNLNTPEELEAHMQWRGQREI